MPTKVLVIGACGQIGTELTMRLREIYGGEQVIASDIREGTDGLMSSGPFETLDAMNKSQIEDICLYYEINEVYLMAAMLSATGEKFPKKAWSLNMDSLMHVLDIAKEGKVDKVFWPSSIAVFGPSTPKQNTGQHTIMEPTTVYGISKQTGERWCEYYFNKYGVDVRSIRYPGLVSWKTVPGGGTTDYAVDIFHKAVKDGSYDCFLNHDTQLPMMYMEDAVRATIEIMRAPLKDIKERSSYNLSGMSFTPASIAEEIKKHLPEFTIEYHPDFRQEIADSWPGSIDDSAARDDWNWKHEYDLDNMVVEMLSHLKKLESSI
ncbi:NAD-dependent epimerase/dehydratase family protein [uncultured Nonlabens sp.]|uniref:NAD-dependent epimerase/dehydratase family protein n=1 Tax=uncultured Nonlabens sp. TaxID=859306 RepID=UPI00263033A3|nr:NAD-dependent epimerase/dehydratase family protein [uncultured Nonlabens sp.]